MQESKNARLEEIGARCAASISGTCLSLLQGFSHCGVSQCDYERAPRPRLLETLLSNLTNDARLNGTENVTDRERWLVEQLNDLHAATRERLAECDRLVERVEAAENALRRARDEIDRWGYGDFHYGNTKRDPKLLAALADIDRVLGTSRVSEIIEGRKNMEPAEAERARELTKAFEAGFGEVQDSSEYLRAISHIPDDSPDA